MKTKLAVFVALVAGLQTAAFASPKGKRVPAPRLPEARVVVNVVDNVTMTASDLRWVIDNIKYEGRKTAAIKPRPGVRARRIISMSRGIIGMRQYALEPFSVVLPPLEGSSRRLIRPGPQNSRFSLAAVPRNSEVSLVVTSIEQGRAQTDILLEARVSQDVGSIVRTRLGIRAGISAYREGPRFGEILGTQPTDALAARLPKWPSSSYARIFVGVIRTALKESLPKALRVVKR